MFAHTMAGGAVTNALIWNDVSLLVIHEQQNELSSLSTLSSGG